MPLHRGSRHPRSQTQPQSDVQSPFAARLCSRTTRRQHRHTALPLTHPRTLTQSSARRPPRQARKPVVPSPCPFDLRASAFIGGKPLPFPRWAGARLLPIASRPPHAGIPTGNAKRERRGRGGANRRSLPHRGFRPASTRRALIPSTVFPPTPRPSPPTSPSTPPPPPHMRPNQALPPTRPRPDRPARRRRSPGHRDRG